MTYIDGFVIPVSQGKKEAYRKMAQEAAPLFQEYGAIGIVECFEDDVRDGKVTDFRRAVNAEPGEHIVFSWIVWPDKATRDAANQRMMTDDRMKPGGEIPFDMQRMVVGGFIPIFQFGDKALTPAREVEREPA
jgi:uncharacterized protein YbaA (DUF1428 family)